MTKKKSISKKNAEGYLDLTAYEALTNIEREAQKAFAFRPVVYICSAELEEGTRLNTATVKQLSSTDEVYAEKKYKDNRAKTRSGCKDDGRSCSKVCQPWA